MTERSLRIIPERWPARLFLLAATLLVAIPLLALVAGAFELGAAATGSALASALLPMLNSAWTAAAATALAVLVATAIALLTERTALPGRRFLRLVMIVSLLVPGYVAAVAWLRAYGPAGLLENATGLALPGLVGPTGVVLVLGVEALPIAYLFLVAALSLRAEPDAERAARVSGAGALTSHWTITLPLLAPTIAAAGAICFVLSGTAFGVPAVLGIPDGFITVTTRIYRDLAFSSDPQAFARAVGLAAVLALAAAAAIAGADVALGGRSVRRTGSATGPLAAWADGPGRPRGPAGGRSHPSGPLVAAAMMAWGLVVVLLAIPFAALILTALTRAPGLPPTPEFWTLDNFGRALDPHTLAALGNSGLLSGAAAVGAIGLGSLAVLARRGRRAGLPGSIVAVSFAIPGSTLAVAMLLAYGLVLRDTLLIILLAYLAKFWLLGYRPLAAGLESMAADAQRAARVSGATAWSALRTITVPLLKPSLLAAGLIVFLFGLHEVTMSSLLYGPGTATLAVVVLNLQQLGDPTVTAALAVLLTLISAAVGLPVLRLLRAAGSRV